MLIKEKENDINHHGGFGEASDEIWALFSVASISTEALTLMCDN